MLPEPVLLPHNRSVELTVVSNQEGTEATRPQQCNAQKVGGSGSEMSALAPTEERSTFAPSLLSPEATAKDCSVTTTAVRYRMRQARKECAIASVRD